MKAARTVAVTALLLAACGGLRHTAKPVVWVGLEPAASAGGLRAGAPTLEVRRFATASPFGTDRVASREGASRWTFAGYHRWVAEPGEMVASCLRDLLSGADLFGAVFTPPAPYDADYRLSGAVRALYWDRDAGRAVVELEAALVAAPDRACGFWVHRVSAPVSGRSVDAYLAAASQALTEAGAALRGDLAGALAARTRPAAP